MSIIKCTVRVFNKNSISRGSATVFTVARAFSAEGIDIVVILFLRKWHHSDDGISTF